jgi:hypothetical protein
MTCGVFLVLGEMSDRCADPESLRVFAEPLFVATVCGGDEGRRTSMFFPLVNAPKVMSGALSWRRQIAVNQRRMMQNAVREIVGNPASNP